jgi:hypothetical protein|tara:strand:+ start:152 stop:334 length:183 start_codon:yes stop_codon:yes gene_type:complete
MNNEEKTYRINLLQNRHSKLHKTIEALEAEKAPEISVKRAKIEKLKLKDEITHLEQLKIG